MGTLEVDKLDPQSGTALEIGTSGDTVTVPSGVTLTVAGALNVTGTTALADGTVAIAELDIDGGTDIGEAIVDADLFVIDNGAGGTNRKTAASRLTTYILGANSIDSDMYVDGSIDNAHIADDAIDSEHYADGSIDNAHIADDAIDSEHYADGSIDTAHIGATQVTGAKLAAAVISAQTALGAEPADTDEFMVSDAGVLKRVDYSYIKGGGITVADQWNLTDGFTGDAAPIAANLTQADHGGFGTLGSAMTQSSGIFTFPSTGIYFVQAEVGWYYHNAHSRYNVIFIQGTTNNSTYVEMAQASQGIYDSDHYTQVSAVTSTLVDVTNVSNVKVRFSVDVEEASVRTLSDVDVGGSPGKNVTTFTFIRLGDT